MLVFTRFKRPVVNKSFIHHPFIQIQKINVICFQLRYNFIKQMNETLIHKKKLNQLNYQSNKSLFQKSMKNIFGKTQNEAQLSQQEQLMQVLRSNPQLMKKYQEQLTKYQSSQKHKNVQQPMTNKEYLEKVKSKQIQKYLDEEGGLMIKADEGFVLKFLDKRSGEKIFVNIVKHEAVDHPEEKQLVDFDNQVGLRIPMSMSYMREDRDKNGNACKVVDVVMNPKIIATAETNLDIFHFMAQIIANYLLEKHKITVSEEMMKKVKGLKYKGTDVQIQRVKAKKSPKIEQLSEQQTEHQKHKQSQEEKLFNEISGQYNNQKKVARPDFRVYIETLEGTRGEYFFDSFRKDNTRLIIIEVDLSILIHSRGIHLQGSTGTIYLLVKGFYELCLRMPLQIESYKASFSLKQRKLYIEGVPQKFKLSQNIQTEQDAVNFNQLTKENKQKKANKIIQFQIENDMLDELV